MKICSVILARGGSKGIPKKNIVNLKGKPLLQAGKPLIWGGTFNLCTKPTRFTIEGRNECAEKGFDKTGFMKIDTGKEQKWIMRFE